VPDRTLAEVMADAARQLQEHHTVEELLADAVVVASGEIDACDAAAISIVGPGSRLETPAASNPEARHSEELQNQLGEGPCLDAIRHAHSVSSPDLRGDERWPEWGRRMTEDVGFRSMVAFQLFTHADNLGALTLYSRQPDAFDPADVALGVALAAHLAVALAAARHIDQLDTAVVNRTNIGIAIGIVMERYSVDRDQAFAVLTRLSSTTNRKLRDVAADLVEGASISSVSPESDGG